MIYAVSKDFVVSVGDELHFAGSVSGSSDFCEKHALEVIASDELLVSTEASDDIGTTMESIILANDSTLLQVVNHPSDQIDGRTSFDS
jgi:hypothetical protein